MLVNKKNDRQIAYTTHLPYKQRVGGSNPSTPTLKRTIIFDLSLPIDKSQNNVNQDFSSYLAKVGTKICFVVLLREKCFAYFCHSVNISVYYVETFADKFILN